MRETLKGKMVYLGDLVLVESNIGGPPFVLHSQAVFEKLLLVGE